MCGKTLLRTDAYVAYSNGYISRAFLTQNIQYVMANRNTMQGRHWLLTIPQHLFMPFLPVGCSFIRGQLEAGNQDGYLHWQVYVVVEKKVRLAGIKSIFGQQSHCELTRSQAARDYVWKEDTRVDGTQFELGRLPHRRNVATDWDTVWESGVTGRIMDVPANIRVVHYRTLRTIAADYATPQPMERRCYVLWGRTGTGKSRDAWAAAGMAAYCKDPRSKFWDGYRGQKHVVFDEFRGAIDVAHILRWCDRYPVNVEIKGSSVPLLAESMWFTSNLHPRDWYPNLDEETLNALLRRLEITHYDGI
jgi:hypothetical protein